MKEHKLVEMEFSVVPHTSGEGKTIRLVDRDSGGRALEVYDVPFTEEGVETLVGFLSKPNDELIKTIEERTAKEQAEALQPETK